MNLLFKICVNKFMHNLVKALVQTTLQAIAYECHMRSMRMPIELNELRFWSDLCGESEVHSRRVCKTTGKCWKCRNDVSNLHVTYDEFIQLRKKYDNQFFILFFCPLNAILMITLSVCWTLNIGLIWALGWYIPSIESFYLLFTLTRMLLSCIFNLLRSAELAWQHLQMHCLAAMWFDTKE